jgi:hypothetical protein
MRERRKDLLAPDYETGAACVFASSAEVRGRVCGGPRWGALKARIPVDDGKPDLDPFLAGPRKRTDAKNRLTN